MFIGSADIEPQKHLDLWTIEVVFKDLVTMSTANNILR
jgi:hypothetical protein